MLEGRGFPIELVAKVVILATGVIFEVICVYMRVRGALSWLIYESIYANT